MKCSRSEPSRARMSSMSNTVCWLLTNWPNSVAVQASAIRRASARSVRCVCAVRSR